MPLILSNHAPKRQNIEGQHHSLLAKDQVLTDSVLPKAIGTRILQITLGSVKDHVMTLRAYTQQQMGRPLITSLRKSP